MPLLPFNLAESIRKYSGNIAFVIDEQKFTYHELLASIGGIQLLMKQHQVGNRIGIIANNDIETYSSILACIISGIAYVPIEPTHPAERNGHIISLAELNFILNSQPGNEIIGLTDNTSCRFLTTNTNEPAELIVPDSITNETAYILFTSGTTGFPKGVPISYGNLEAFARNVAAMNLKITENSRFLQVFDLTFDLSVFSYLIPMLYGASVYTLPKSPLRHILSLELIDSEQITHLLSVPSFVNSFFNYFSEIELHSITHWLFCGEALKSKMTGEWKKCLPNARIINVYGPTEATIFCTEYDCSHEIEHHNGTVCIGKPFPGTDFSLLRDAQANDSGELLIGGDQLSKGYLYNSNVQYDAFFESENGLLYKTGDICTRDEHGNYFYIGRKDKQVKIQGFRIETGEVEYHANQLDGIKDAVVIAHEKSDGNFVLAMFYTSDNEISTNTIIEQLQKKIPHYMIPSDFVKLDQFPLNVNGKTDRKALLKLFE